MQNSTSPDIVVHPAGHWLVFWSKCGATEACPPQLCPAHPSARVSHLISHGQGIRANPPANPLVVSLLMTPYRTKNLSDVSAAPTG